MCHGWSKLPDYGWAGVTGTNAFGRGMEFVHIDNDRGGIAGVSWVKRPCLGVDETLPTSSDSDPRFLSV